MPERVRARAVAVARAPPAEGPLEDAGAEDATRIICQRCYQAKHYGKLVPLAVSSSMRARSLPNVPTMVEAGLKADAVYPFYTAAFLPAKTPHAIAEKLHAEIMKALALPAVQDRLTAVGVDPMPMTMTEFGAFFKKDVANNIELVKAAKMPTQ